MKKLLTLLAATISPTATPRCRSLLRAIATFRLFAIVVCAMFTGELQATSWTLSEKNSSYQDERIEATQNGGESDTFDVEVPAGKKAVVHVYVSSVTSQNTGGKTVYLKWNGGSEQLLSGQGASDSHTFTSNGSVTIGVRCSAGTHQVPHTRPTTIGGNTFYSTYYTTEYWTYYQCAVTYSISVSYESLLPDLKVSPLVLSSVEVPVDETVTLSFTVRNDGGRSAGESSVARVYVDDVQVGGDVPIGALAAGEAEEKTLPLPRQIAGEHTVRVDVDVMGRIEEGSENNNSSSATLVIYERMPYTVRFNSNGGMGTMSDQSFVAGTAQALDANRFMNGDWQFAGWATSADGEPEYDDRQTLVALTRTSGAIVTLYAVWKHLWTIDENGVLTAADLGKKRNITIPDGVTSIGKRVFYYNTNLTYVVMPSSVTNIGEWAFRGCENLTNVILSSSLVSIGDDAFSWCRNLKHVEIPSSVKSIGKNVFWFCDKLERAIVSEGVEAVGFNMFAECKSLSYVSLPQSLTEIRVGALSLCYSLEEVAIPQLVTNIGESAFSWCTNLTELAIPEGVKNIGKYAFERCSRLSCINIPEDIASIERAVFKGCQSLSGIDIPEGVTNIEMEAFSGCGGLKDVLIPSTVEQIGIGAFHECTGLRRVVFAGKGAAPTIRGSADKEIKKITYLFGLFGEDHTSDCIVYVRRGSSGWETEMVDYRTIRRYDHIVRFDTNGGRMEGCILPVDAGDVVGELPTPMWEGHVFLGWYTAVSGGIEVTAETIVTGDVTYYAHWTEVVESPKPDPEPTSDSIPDPVTPGYEVIEATDITAPYEAPKAVTLQGVVYDGNGAVVGIVELKLGKVNTKKKTSKVSGLFTGLDGKKITMKAANADGIDGTAPASVSLEVKNLGTMNVTIGGTMFAGSLGGCHVQSENVGGNWAGRGANVTVEADDLSMFAGTVLEELLPDGELATVNNGKWSFSKAAGVKWAKPKKGAAQPEIFDEQSGKGLLIDDTKGKTNLSGLKLTYMPKKGTFKGSFKVYALEGSGKATKLKKYTVNVSGVVVDGVGYGTATCKRPAAKWPVTIK